MDKLTRRIFQQVFEYFVVHTFTRNVNLFNYCLDGDDPEWEPRHFSENRVRRSHFFDPRTTHESRCFFLGARLNYSYPSLGGFDPSVSFYYPSKIIMDRDSYLLTERNPKAFHRPPETLTLNPDAHQRPFSFACSYCRDILARPN